MFGPLMINTWIAATAVAVIAGVTGFFAVLRGSTFAAHAIPNGAFAGAAGASLLGLNPFVGLAVFSVGGGVGIAGVGRRAAPPVRRPGVVLGGRGARHRRSEPPRAVRRGHRADVRDDARHRRAVRQLEQ